jgi:arginine N-succinyltransferase
VRFLYLGIHRNKFKRKVLAELMPPLDAKGHSFLWEAIGRRFTNMDYWEADKLCQQNKEFIFSLFPSGKMYTTFFPAEARNSIGKVGKDTEPVLHMLKKIGFEYKSQVDPFDGGPHLWAHVDEIVPVKKQANYVYAEAGEAFKAAPAESGLMCKVQQKVGEFRALSVQALLKDGKLAVREPAAGGVSAALGLAPGESVVFMPFY